MAGDATPVIAAATADLIADAVRSIPGVVGLHGGTYGEVATYLPGRRVTGVRLSATGTEVHVVLASATAIVVTAEAIRRRVQALVPGDVDVTIQDVVGV